MKNKAFTLVELLVVIAIVGTLAAIILPMSGCRIDHTKSTVVAKVRDKDSVRMGSGDFAYSTYLIYTDKETFENIDSSWIGKDNADELYGLIERGKTYRFELVGTKSYDNYRNIMSIQEVILSAEKE